MSHSNKNTIMTVVNDLFTPGPFLPSKIFIQKNTFMIFNTS